MYHQELTPKSFEMIKLLLFSDVAVLSKFAILENKAGHSEEAQALFENIVTTYPARVDIWSVYVDMLIKSQLIDMAR
jgi:rRNA biogenesis protein RRP5